MTVNRRDLLSASALLLAGPAFSLRVASAEAAPAAPPVVLCWNENPYGPSPAARLAVSRAIPEGCRYPSEPEMQDLSAALARHEGTDVQHIVTGSGSGELLCALALAVRARGRGVHRRGADVPGTARLRARPGCDDHGSCRWTRGCAMTCPRCSAAVIRPHARDLPVQSEQPDRHSARRRRDPRLHRDTAAARGHDRG